MTVPGFRPPDSQQLAEIWTQMLCFRPEAIWVGCLRLHALETPIVRREEYPLAAADAALLALMPAAEPSTLEALEARTAIGQRCLTPWLRALAARGLVCEEAPRTWALTPAGRNAQSTGRERRPVLSRHCFYFVEPETSAPPRLLVFETDPRPYGIEAEEFYWDAATLAEHLARPREWKRRRHLPEDAAVPTERELAALLRPWERISLHASLYLPVALAEGTPSVGFPVTPEGELAAAEPILHFASREEWEETIGDWLVEPNVEAWRAAWLTTCRERGLAHGDLAVCRLVRQGNTLCVYAPASLYDLLRPVTACGEQWWTRAGDRLLQRAARIEVLYAVGPG